MADGDNLPQRSNWNTQADAQLEQATIQSVAIPPAGSDGSIRWTASEFIAHHKSPGWYLVLTSVAIVVALIIWFLFKDKISVGVILFSAVIFGLYAARKPRQQQYQIDEQGVMIGQRAFDYGEFRSFAIEQEDAFAGIVFMPLKRFMPLITIYYAPQDEAKIIELLGERLPMERRQADMIERFMRRIRF
jgi:hypothetical protein